jgi:glycosyltransferase involved in cell wall biosynthesis
MIILVHQNNKTIKVLAANKQPITGFNFGGNVTTILLQIAIRYSDELIIWCKPNYLEHLNIDDLDKIFHHQRILASYNPFKFNYIPNQIGYIERSYFLKINKQVSYPTWLTSSLIGGINSCVINNLKDELNFSLPFDYFLNSLAKRSMTEGLFCYSEPKLLTKNITANLEIKQASTYQLFKFVKQHYKWVWVFFLSFCYLMYEKKFTVFPLLRSLFYPQLPTVFDLDGIPIQSTKKVVDKKEIDVIIPTIGRKDYLYDVLKDLAKQTLLPKNVIIVEQNPLENSVSELNYLTTEYWPFNIKHTFTNQLGVCNARNIALNNVISDWVFFADDDIRLSNSFFNDSFNIFEAYGVSACSFLCLRPGQNQMFFRTHQTTVFGAGSSMVTSKVLKGLKFNLDYEFGFGEDLEFGMQLRNKGIDIAFIPNLKIKHLKAPIGGYRTKVKKLWHDDDIAPKPAPTIMLLNETYFTKQQLLGYKLLLGIRSYKNTKTKNPITYMKYFKKQWKRSQFWSAKLRSKTNA